MTILGLAIAALIIAVSVIVLTQTHRRTQSRSVTAKEIERDRIRIEHDRQMRQAEARAAMTVLRPIGEPDDAYFAGGDRVIVEPPGFGGELFAAIVLDVRHGYAYVIPEEPLQSSLGQPLQWWVPTTLLEHASPDAPTRSWR